MSNLCVLDHGNEDAEALPALRLCKSHRRRLEHDLRDLPRLHAELGDALATGGTGTFGGRVSGSSAEPLPINPAVAEHRDQIKHDLESWCLFVADKRGLTKLPADTVPDIANWLLAHVEWIAGHAAAAVECPPVMREIVGRARALIAPSGAKRIKIGKCPSVGDEGPCQGALYATVRREDDARPSLIYCDSCDFEKEPLEWLRFGREYTRKSA